MDAILQVKAGSKVMVTMPTRAGAGKKYSLTDGTEISSDQFESMKPFLKPCDPGLLDAEPQSYQWAG